MGSRQLKRKLIRKKEYGRVFVGMCSSEDPVTFDTMFPWSFFASIKNAFPYWPGIVGPCPVLKIKVQFRGKQYPPSLRALGQHGRLCFRILEEGKKDYFTILQESQEAQSTKCHRDEC